MASPYDGAHARHRHSSGWRRVTAPTKREVRHAARERRRAAAAALASSPGERAVAARAVADAVLGLLARRGVSAPARVAVYESLPLEPPTDALVAALLDARFDVVVPVTLADLSLEWRRAVRGGVADPSEVGRMRREPDAEERSGWLGADALGGCALVVTPGLSVDRAGTRLGQGGGSYDRALAHRRPGTLVVTLLHEGEASDAPLPREPHDLPVDGWVTTAGDVVLLG